MSDFPTPGELNDLVCDYFTSQGREVSYDPATGLGVYGEAEFSVHNVAANLARIDREDWPEYVAWHFGHLLDGGPPELPSSYIEVSRRLRVRLAADDWVEALPVKETARRVAEDLHEVLMVSIAGSAVSLPPDSLKLWGEPLDRLWDDARKNTVLEEPSERRALLKPTGERFTWVRGSWWVASLLLDLGRYLSPGNPHGALAMVPVRDALLFHEIVDEGVVKSLQGMMEVGLQFHLEGPDSVSPHVYWWRDSEIRRVVFYGDGQLNASWGEEFSGMLAELESSIERSALN